MLDIMVDDMAGVRTFVPLSGLAVIAVPHDRLSPLAPQVPVINDKGLESMCHRSSWKLARHHFKPCPDMLARR
jgi:hypothetical protein